ncbi:MAG: HAD hydrolase family protein [Candidatus Omnitrophica bacterium]|nr:HAD hydrolase family protein [Candidatus Omnitrophota bacterium]
MQERIKKIKLLALDVDGVLTDGLIIVDSEGREIKNFDVQDGYGIVRFKRAGFFTAIITARYSEPVTARAKDLQIDHLYQDAYPKLPAYEKLISDLKVRDEEVCFVGDDLPDLPILKRVGLAVAVANARPEVKATAHYITERAGGDGAVREVIELILKTQGLWEKILRGEI